MTNKDRGLKQNMLNVFKKYLRDKRGKSWKIKGGIVGNYSRETDRSKIQLDLQALLIF